ncbi:hypothetical protein NOR53_1155 [gamma proteobacterium NOR5-3]|nr:hypothetical protein NOR53_1155 [gamma proteobacterium NOR5-3]
MPITSSGRYAIDASWVFPDKAKKDLSVEGKCFLEQSIVQDKVKTKLEEMVESNRQRGGKQSPPDRIEYFEFKP